MTARPFCSFKYSWLWELLLLVNDCHREQTWLVAAEQQSQGSWGNVNWCVCVCVWWWRQCSMADELLGLRLQKKWMQVVKERCQDTQWILICCIWGGVAAGQVGCPCWSLFMDSISVCGRWGTKEMAWFTSPYKTRPTNIPQDTFRGLVESMALVQGGFGS